MDRRQIIAHVMHEVDSIIDRQRTIERVKNELDQRKQNPHEEDFIYDEATNGQRIFREVVDGVEIEKTVLHRRGSQDTDISGADLLYEIVGEKYILVQYKKSDKNGRVKNDKTQLEELIASCSNSCPPFSPHMLGVCGSWYCLIDGGNLSYMPACIAHATFSGKASCTASSFNKTLDRDAFLSAFSKCYVGARIDEWPYHSFSPSSFLLFAQSSVDPFIVVRQHGLFRRTV